MSLLVLIRSLSQLRMLLVEVINMREPLCSRRVVMARVDISAFLLKLLSIAAWAVLHWTRCLIKAAERAVVFLLPKSLSLLSALIQPFT